jgi:hypothetical protein
MVEAVQSLLRSSSQNEQILSERIAELELAVEDSGWQRILGRDDGFEFSNYALRRILRLSRLYALKNPSIKRPVNLQAVYVWGQGCSIHAEDPEIDKIVQGFLADPGNQRTLTSPGACMDNERLQRVEGNTFFRLFTKPSGRVQVRLIPTDQILDGDIIRNPDDASEPWFYVRRWRDGEEERTAVYPDREYARSLVLRHPAPASCSVTAKWRGTLSTGRRR